MIRPSFLSAQIDGRKTLLSGGPEDGGTMHVEFTVLDHGEIVPAFRVDTSIKDGVQTITVSHDGNVVFEKETFVGDVV